jgi:hypothetical protein
MNTFPPKDYRETRTLTFTFSGVPSSPTTAIEWYGGVVDGTPGTVIQGTTSAISGNTVSIQAHGGVRGADYIITVTATVGNDIETVSGILPVTVL